MITLIKREFTVNVTIAVAWAHLSAVENWPSWAKHIRSVEVTPKGELTLDSTGIIRLNNGIKSEFRMSEFNPKKNWKWVGPFLGLTVYYDHQFERIDEGQTRLTWIVACEGFGAAVLGRAYAFIYNKNLDRAIPNLIAEINASTSASNT